MKGILLCPLELMRQKIDVQREISRPKKKVTHIHLLSYYNLSPDDFLRAYLNFNCGQLQSKQSFL